jgi:thiamine kinase-like enzyme
VLYFDDEGIKISVFLENSCFIDDAAETLPLLRKLHTSGIKVNHSYGIENLKRWNFPGAAKPKQLEKLQDRIDELISHLASLEVPQVLCHGDACTLNCLRLSNGSLRLIDWEQAGMGDPIVDIAVAAVHMDFNEVEAGLHLKRYLERKPSKDELFRLNAYIALHCFAWVWWYDPNDECLAIGKEYLEKLC